MARRSPWLWITDPWNTLDHEQDTTLRLMEAAHQLKQPCYWADVRTLRWQEGEVRADVALCSSSIRKPKSEPRTQEVHLREFSQIHYRVDPPVDLHYLHPLQMLCQSHRSIIVNPPEAIALLSEKTIAEDLPTLAPRTLVSSEVARLQKFIEQEGRVILKPLHGAQSIGVERLEADLSKSALAQRLHVATENQTRPVLLQEFIPEIETEGETRLWFVNGKLLACAQKIPARGEFKVDMDRGARLEKTQLSKKDLPGVRLIGRWLKKNRIQLAAVDWIHSKITDFNITSPGLIVGMERVLREDLATRIIRELQ